MITRKEKILWIFYAAVLVLLFLLSSTDFIIKEQETEIYSLSVIIEGTGEEHYMNFRKGMDRAAIELNADVSFISLYEENNQHQQLEMMVREQQDGARALIVMPTKEAAMATALTEQNITVPLVLVNSELASDQISAVVTADYAEMGRKLAKQMIRRHPDKPPVWLISGAQESEVTGKFGEGLCTTLAQAGYGTTLLQKQNEKTFLQAAKELADSRREAVLVVALDQESLTEMAAILADGGVKTAGVRALYGRGTTIPILNYLDRGVISGICVTDEFSAGYISVKRAVEAVTNQKTEKTTLMESYYIEKEDLRNARYEKILYPIE